MEEIKSKVINIIKTKKGNMTIPEDTSENLLTSGIIDSFDIVDLIGSLEDTFVIEIDGDDIIPENFKSIDTIVKLVVKYKQ